MKIFIKLLLILLFVIFAYASIDRVFYKDDTKDKKNIRQEACLKSKDYVGECKDGKKHGKGTFTMPSGAIYVGEFKDDLFHGRGTITLKDGKQSTGIFKYGELREIINKNY
jgi:hypothetical protein